MVVKTSKYFSGIYKNFPHKDREMIYAFIQHIEQNGFNNLEGLNKESHHVDKNHPEFIVRVRYAIRNNLWHYHIGIVRYDISKPFGFRTSEYILHYVKGNDFIKIVDYSDHPPFKLPKEDYLD